MNTWFESIVNGIQLYICLAPALILIALVYGRGRKELNPVWFVLNQLTILYIICLVSVTLFPLPTAEQAARLSTHEAQLVPFRFVSDILREKSIRCIAQVVFNVAMTVPFGFILCFNKKMTVSKAVMITFCLSLLIEITQLTGMFFLYNGSYRLFDVDDLFLNTLGGFAGFRTAVVLLPKMVRKPALHVAHEY